MRLHEADEPPPKSAWLSTGRLTDGGHAAIDRWVKRTQMRQLSPAAVARVFAYQIRSEAKKDVDRAIGTSLHLAVLPRTVVDRALKDDAPDILVRRSRDGTYVHGQAMTVDLAAGQSLHTTTLSELLYMGQGPSWFGRGATVPLGKS